MKKIFALVLALTMLLCVAASAEVTAKVALITMDSIDEYWVGMQEGAYAKVDELNAEGNNIEIVWLAPETKDNQQQIEKIQSAIADSVDYILIAANDATSCNRALQEALDAGIKIIYVDAAATLEASATFMTNNFQGGVTAGEYMLNLLTEKGITSGTIGIVDAQPGVQSCQDRYDGFVSAFEGTEFVFSERQYSDGDIAKAQELGTTLINNGVVAIYGTNNGATIGAAAACKDAANNGTTVYCVGWDSSEANNAHIEGGELNAYMLQNPDVMGAMGIEAVVALANGEDLGGEVVDTGVTVVDASNIDQYK